MLADGSQPTILDRQTIDILVERVAAELREQIGALAAELARPKVDRGHLTVADVAERLGVARSTVYAHWREWGGFKLTDADKAPIRFDSTALPILAPQTAQRDPVAISAVTARPRRRRKRRDLLGDEPRFTHPLDEIA